MEFKENVDKLPMKKLSEKAINKLFPTAVSYPQIKNLKFSILNNRIQCV